MHVYCKSLHSSQKSRINGKHIENQMVVDMGFSSSSNLRMSLRRGGNTRVWNKGARDFWPADTLGVRSTMVTGQRLLKGPIEESPNTVPRKVSNQ